MSENFREGLDETPWGMPKEVWWDLTDGAQVRRAQWIIDNCPGVQVDDLRAYMALQPSDEDQLRPRAELPPEQA